MKNYLICNTQDVLDAEGNVLGKRVCDVSDSTFPVSDDYEWKEYAEYFDIYTGQWYWSDKPTEYVAPTPQPTAEQNKDRAVTLLQQTDWVNQPDVTNTSLNPHLLNQGDFLVYRSQLRAIAVNPTAGNLDWPTKPQEQWSS